ncbi:MAG: hypothetical protein AB1705_03820 [Verrucomicrobiota bacterium]
MLKKLLLLLVVLALAFGLPRLGARWLRALENALGRVARRHGLAVLLAGLAAFAISAGITTLIGPSPPHIHDEFANLLAADTFVKGRLTNPPHPLWEHFEGVHILSQPRYMSKYPPAQGLMLAVGQALTGKPYVGLWLSAALACAALCWALLAWVPARWALLGGLLAATHPIIVKWSQVYWGGLEAVLGGALVLGAFRRILKPAQNNNASPLPLSHGFLLGLGMGILANSRPFEGFVFCLLTMGFFFIWCLGGHCPPFTVLFQRVGLPMAAALAPIFLFMGLYNYRATGHPLRMAYMEYERQYAVAPFMVWQKPRATPEYRHDFIRRHMLDYALVEHQRQQNLPGLLKESRDKVQRLLQAFWPFRPWYLWAIVAAIPLAAFCCGWRRDGWAKLASVLTLLFFAGLMLETWMWDRYAAPSAALIAVIVLMAYRRLRVFRWEGRPVGLFLARAMVGLCLLAPIPWTMVRAKEYAEKPWDYQRLAIIRDLEQRGGQHLIIVRYAPTQSVHDDWVHNGADIDAQAVIWARHMEGKNQRLLDYYKDRSVWLLEPHKEPVKLEAYRNE